MDKQLNIEYMYILVETFGNTHSGYLNTRETLKLLRT